MRSKFLVRNCLITQTSRGVFFPFKPRNPESACENCCVIEYSHRVMTIPDPMGKCLTIWMTDLYSSTKVIQIVTVSVPISIFPCMVLVKHSSEGGTATSTSINIPPPPPSPPLQLPLGLHGSL